VFQSPFFMYDMMLACNARRYCQALAAGLVVFALVITRYFKKLEKRYGIKDFHPHKLRHTSASISLTHGGDLVSVSQRLGHSDTAVTLRMYAHANSESIRRAGQAVRDALKAQGE